MYLCFSYSIVHAQGNPPFVIFFLGSFSVFLPGKKTISEAHLKSSSFPHSSLPEFGILISRNNERETINVSFYLVPKWRTFSTLVCGLARVILFCFSWLCITCFKEGCNCIVELLLVKRFGYIAIHATLETPGLCCLDHISCHGKYGYPHWAALRENANRHPLWSFLLCLPYKTCCFKPADTITRLYTWGGNKETQLCSPHSLGLPIP